MSVIYSNIYKSCNFSKRFVLFSVDAVYAAAHAIHNLIAALCGTDPFYFCAKLQPPPDGSELLKYLRNVSFIGIVLVLVKNTFLLSVPLKDIKKM